jgi:hypothetical protein
MNCANHADKTAITTCTKCKRPLCEDCTIHWPTGVTCKHCLEAEQLKSAKRPAFHKSPGLAATLSLMPGMGQIYVGYYTAGFINLMIVASIITVLNSSMAGNMEPFFGLFLAFFWVFNMFDAAKRARLFNEYQLGKEEAKIPTDSPLVGGLILLTLGLILTLTVTFDFDLEFLEPIWPLAIVAIGAYMIFKYRKTKQDMIQSNDYTRPDSSKEQDPTEIL